MIKVNNKVPTLILEWANSISKNSDTEMLTYYTKKSILLGTYMDSYTLGLAGIFKYFEMFFRENHFISCEILENTTQVIGRNTKIASGLYLFTTPEAEIEARYSFVIKRMGQKGDWKIINHHSSLPAKK